MGLFDALRNRRNKREQRDAPKRPASNDAMEREALNTYSWMRVEVSGQDTPLFFLGNLSFSDSGRAQLQQIGEAIGEPDPPEKEFPEDDDPEPPLIRVLVRGYDEKQKLAVHMTGVIRRFTQTSWRVEGLRIEGKDNDRAFFRYDTIRQGTLTRVPKEETEEEQAAKKQAEAEGAEPEPPKEMGPIPCEIRDVSAGGVRIRTKETYEMGEQVTLETDIFTSRKIPPLACLVQRIIDKKEGYKKAAFHEYGLKFLDLDVETVDRMAHIIMELQMKEMKRQLGG